VLLSCAAAGACARGGRPTLTLAGSTSVQPFAEKWVEAYGARHPEVAIEVQGGGSTTGARAALTGAVEIGMSSRPFTSEEIGRVVGAPVARDAIALVVHPANSVRDLGAVRQMVANDPGAVGYLSLGLADGSVKPLSLAGVVPSEASVDVGRYPLVRPLLFVVLPGATTTAARAFIDWITGPEGRALTRREGLSPPEV
jgi:ABC-type phosphate transport system substrate-binding protein